MSTLKNKVSKGTRTTPPPNPVSAPTRPATSELPHTSRLNSRMLIKVLSGPGINQRILNVPLQLRFVFRAALTVARSRETVREYTCAEPYGGIRIMQRASPERPPKPSLDPRGGCVGGSVRVPGDSKRAAAFRSAIVS